MISLGDSISRAIKIYALPEKYLNFSKIPFNMNMKMIKLDRRGHGMAFPVQQFLLP